MSLISDLRILYHMAASSNRGRTHAERIEGFYQGQASAYDDFRRRLLQGREALFAAVDPPDNGVWVDMGGGTGVSLEFMGDRLSRLRKAYVVDLSPSLLGQARERIAARGWTNVEAVEADVTTFVPPENQVDLITFSYSLTMIPDWFAAIDQALTLLRPGGRIGVVDFYVARKHADGDRAKHGWSTRAFWPLWFSCDNVFLSPDHLPYLERRFDSAQIEERRARLPYLPLIRAPYYIYVGAKRTD